MADKKDARNTQQIFTPEQIQIIRKIVQQEIKKACQEFGKPMNSNPDFY